MGDFSSGDRELLEVLSGTRQRGAMKKAAVLIEDLAAIADMPMLKSTSAAGDPPTAAEYDALVADVHDLHRRVALVAEALRRRVERT